MKLKLCYDEVITGNVSRSEEPDSEAGMEDDDGLKQTPIKSWLRKHMNSEKSPEREDSPPPKTKTSSNLPQYIIPLVGNDVAIDTVFHFSRQQNISLQ